MSPTKSMPRDVTLSSAPILSSWFLIQYPLGNNAAPERIDCLYADESWLALSYTCSALLSRVITMKTGNNTLMLVMYCVGKCICPTHFSIVLIHAVFLFFRFFNGVFNCPHACCHRWYMVLRLKGLFKALFSSIKTTFSFSKTQIPNIVF